MGDRARSVHAPMHLTAAIVTPSIPLRRPPAPLPIPPASHKEYRMLQTPRATRGMVVAPHHLAAQAGLRVLREG
ncbi:MAG: hypothetical protein ACE5LB_15550, partial [Acidiferrobacterales bacterium]